MISQLIAVVLSYLLGSVSFAVVVSAAMGLSDPRSYGSGNPGATNVLRSGNRKAAILTLVGDALKGWLAVWLVSLWVHTHGWTAPDAQCAIAASGIAVFVGHLWPIFFRFQGGKGVATAAGVLFAIHPLLGLATLATWLVMAAVFRYSSLAALAAALAAPFYHAWLSGGANRITWAVAVMSLLLIWRHKANITKLLSGTESKLGGKKKT
ncbi:glycerol-3-phosphate acyltransferase [Robbsia andropogonis]|uniref:Glycerol-3-phosphate acyltransferase n=1 Tax=Robbsia andropogonis TaxID=28092 RepID=A0A0F5JYY0_9BURK|nr:glycerol-3-phosphate 1-O-acyltransferase PlsY [Robbsia andropogonis]KKB63081.1 glycerol-3-phosphate acyltransferase [Robbsia andropogonis]